MGYVLNETGLTTAFDELVRSYRLYAPVLKQGEGRFEGTDVVRYDFVTSPDQICWDRKSDYAFKEILLPLSQTLFFFEDGTYHEAERNYSDVIVLLRSCDLHAVRRLDQMYLANGLAEDPFYKKMREHLHFAWLRCNESFDSCFCQSMGTDVPEPGSWELSLAWDNEHLMADVPADDPLDLGALLGKLGKTSADTEPAPIRNDFTVRVPEHVPNAVYQHSMWDEYTTRCINCGRCCFVCPTCTCYTMQDVFYTDTGRGGARRRVAASCMVDGYTEVAGGGQYRRTNGERMRFKVLHKVHDFRQRFGYDMCVGCGRCDDVCPEYISFAACVNRLYDACEEVSNDE
jgi:anaerobic sulfite reductase subunit A